MGLIPLKRGGGLTSTLTSALLCVFTVTLTQLNLFKLLISEMDRKIEREASRGEVHGSYTQKTCSLPTQTVQNNGVERIQLAGLSVQFCRGEYQYFPIPVHLGDILPILKGFW